MGRRFSGLWTVFHPLLNDQGFDLASSRFDTRFVPGHRPCILAPDFQGTWERWTGQLDGNGGGWNQFIAQSNGLVLEFKERGFLESKLVDGWVKFLVGLFVFEQVVNEASQFARCGRGRLGRSKVGLLTPVEDAQTGLGTAR